MLNPEKTNRHLRTLRELHPSVEPDLEAVADHLHDLATDHHAALVREGQLNMALEHPELGAYALQREVHLRNRGIELRANLNGLYHQELCRLLGAVIKAEHVHEYLQAPVAEKAALLAQMIKDGRATKIVVPVDVKG